MDGTDRSVASEFSWPSSFSVCFIFGPRRAAYVGSRFPEQEWSSVAPAGEAQESQPLGCPGGVLPREYQLFPTDFWRLGCNRRSLQGGKGRHRAPAHASSYRWETSPCSQRPVWRGLHLFTAWGSPLGLFLSEKDPPPQAVATATGHPHLAGDGRSPGTPCTHWPVRRLPGALPASLPWVGPGERCLQPSWPLSLGPKLSCLASWVVPEPKMHGHCPIYCK